MVPGLINPVSEIHASAATLSYSLGQYCVECSPSAFRPGGAESRVSDTQDYSRHNAALVRDSMRICTGPRPGVRSPSVSETEPTFSWITPAHPAPPAPRPVAGRGQPALRPGQPEGQDARWRSPGAVSPRVPGAATRHGSVPQGRAVPSCSALCAHEPAHPSVLERVLLRPPDLLRHLPLICPLSSFMPQRMTRTSGASEHPSDHSQGHNT